MHNDKPKQKFNTKNIRLPYPKACDRTAYALVKSDINTISLIESCVMESVPTSAEKDIFF